MLSHERHFDMIGVALREQVFLSSLLSRIATVLAPKKR